eukprot:1833055-Rhodomonas_salina.1
MSGVGGSGGSVHNVSTRSSGADTLARFMWETLKCFGERKVKYLGAGGLKLNLLRGHAREAEHADLVNDVVPVPGGPL